MIFLSVLAGMILLLWLFLQHESFGRLPTGERQERIIQSPNYRNNHFQNLSHTPSLTEGVSYREVMAEFFFSRKSRMKPSRPLPSVKTDLHQLAADQNMLVWFGHSSYFLQVDGKKILVDPVLSGSASPLPFGTRSFAGTDRYSPDDIPEIDYLFITHDHWDHLDYKSIKALKPKIKQAICGLGTAAHLERWGLPQDLIIEKDWDEKVELGHDFTVHTSPARHFSGRGLSRNKSLWTAFILQSPTKQIYLGGDSGYDTHFAEIGKKFGPFDLAILENGQYDKSWKYIHMMPDEVLQAGIDLQAKRLLPVHSAKFALGNHAWDEPLRKISELNEKLQLPLMTPMIGELVHLDDANQSFSRWWEGIH